MAIHGKTQPNRMRGKTEMQEKINMEKKACRLASEILARQINKRKVTGNAIPSKET
jgi:hypothetical protein